MSFEVWVSAAAGSVHWGATTYSRDSSTIPVWIGSTGSVMYYPIWLPAGSTIQAIEYWHWRVASGSLTLRCWRNDIPSGARTQVGTTKSITSGTTRMGTLDSGIDHVMLQDNSYVLEWENVSGGNYFYGARILYSNDALPAGGERSFRWTVPSSGKGWTVSIPGAAMASNTYGVWVGIEDLLGGAPSAWWAPSASKTTTSFLFNTEIVLRAGATVCFLLRDPA
jgi:hypothetical protein